MRLVPRRLHAATTPGSSARAATRGLRWITAVSGFAVLVGAGVGVVMPAAGASPRTDPHQTEIETGHHHHPVCGQAMRGQARCQVQVIDRGASDPTPLVSSTTPYGAAPATIKSAYGFPTSSSAGAGTTIAIVGAYNDPTAQSDLDTFDAAYGLPCNGCLTKVNQNGGTRYPAVDATWALESSLDVQWAHAIAPAAHILLVETNTNNWSDLMAGVDYAKAHAGYVSASWGGPEFSGQSSYDSHFSAPGVSFFAAAGDHGLPAYYPSTSPNVVSVGGTSLNNLGFPTMTEVAWASGGGGCSAYEPATAAQRAFSEYPQASCASGMRATPDVSLDGDPVSGVSVYDSTPTGTSSGWFKVGGTSASSPMWAARAAVAGGVMDAARIYGTNPPPFKDITSGSNGAPAMVGYDLATGRGSWSDIAPPPPPPPPPTGAGITNGGFETANLTGWTSTGPATSVTSAAHSGSYGAQAGSTNPTYGDSSIVQRFTVPSNGTAASFWYKMTCPDGVTFDWATATLSDNTAGGTTTVLPHTCTTNAWAQVTSPVTAGHDYTLTLTSHDDNSAGDASYTQFDDATIITSGGSPPPPPPAADFSISANPASMTVASNSTGTATVSTAVTAGSSAPVNLTVAVSPAGPSVALNPVSVNAGSAAGLTVSSGSATPGNYTMTVTGTEGTAAHSATVTVTIPAPPAPAGGITNGGFETGNLTGWTATGASTAVTTAAVHTGVYAAQGGSTGPTNGDSTIAQRFTVPAVGTTVSFWYKMSCPDGVTYDWATATLTDNTAGGTTTVLPRTCATNVWTQVSSTVSPGHDYTLTLTSHDDNYAGDASYTVFDDIAVR